MSDHEAEYKRTLAPHVVTDRRKVRPDEIAAETPEDMEERHAREQLNLQRASLEQDGYRDDGAVDAGGYTISPPQREEAGPEDSNTETQSEEMQPQVRHVQTAFLVYMDENNNIGAENNLDQQFVVDRPANMGDFHVCCTMLAQEITAAKTSDLVMMKFAAAQQQLVQQAEAQRIAQQVGAQGMPGMNRQQRRHPGR